jgi:DNA-binding NtrC family response regulator
MTKQPDARLLLVDDEIDFLEAVKRALGRRGFAVEAVSSGAAALEALEGQPFDVAVLDVKMPGIDGVELFRRLAHLRPALPVVILTGHGSIEQAFETSREGVADYIAKPVDMDHLAHVCRRAIKEAAKQARDTGPSADDGRTVSVLLVDDEPDFLAPLSKVLSRRNMAVATAGTGTAALALLGERVFDVVVLDIKLPDLDGITVLERIKRMAPLTEVILLTGHPTIATAMRGLELGAFDFFVKPHDANRLARTIREAFWRREERKREEVTDLVDELVRKWPT